MDKDAVTRHYFEVRGCKIKRTYTKRKEAKEAARTMNRINDSGRVRVYSCEFCGHYHIGHMRIPYEDRKENERIANILKNAT